MESNAIISLARLRWGLYRLFTDAFCTLARCKNSFPKIESAYNSGTADFFGKRRFHTDTIKSRGPALPLTVIPKDDRYLISEMACKSYDESADGGGAPGK